MADTPRANRRSVRLRNYDYSQPGAYFVTICVHRKRCLFGRVVDGKMILNRRGCIVAECWPWLTDQYPYLELDHFEVMPNHLHGIIMLYDHVAGDSRRGGSRAAQAKVAGRKPLGQLIGAFKTVSTKEVNRHGGRALEPLWQRNYHEHIIRDEAELLRVQQYIADNPLKWAVDRENPAAEAGEPDEPWQA